MKKTTSAKKIRQIVLILLITFVVVIPYGKVEFLTWRYGKEFTELYKVTNMIDGIAYLKVMDYSSENAEIYYITKDHKARVLYQFEKRNGEWELKSWDAVWSKTGNADNFMWPYYR